MTPIPLVAVLVAGLGLAPAMAGADPPHPGIAQKYLDLTLDPARRTLEGSLRLQRPPGPWEFRLREDLGVDAVKAGGLRLQISRAGRDRYRVEVPEGAPPLVVTWSGTLPGPGEQDNGLFMDRRGGFLPPGQNWYPRSAERLPFALDLVARVPSGQRLVAGGSLVGEPEDDGRHYTARHLHPRTDEVALATGPWLERTAVQEGVRIRTLFPEALDSAHGQTYLEYAGEYLQMFSGRAGPYPFESFTMAASPVPVGLALAGFTLLGERVIPLPFIPRSSLAHELLHGWWGSGVGVDYGSGNWSEALTTYMADHHLDAQRGEDRETRRRWLLGLAALPPGLDRPLVSFRGGNQGVERIIGYSRGAMVLHMLNRRMGPSAFDAGTRLFRERHLFRPAGWDDLQAAFSDAAGEALDGFLDPWLQRPGLPELRLSGVQHQADGGGWEIRGVLEQVQATEPWPMDVPVVVETRSGPVRHTVAMQGRRADFRLRLQDPPLAVAADPDYDVLRRLHDAPPILRMPSLDPATRLAAAGTDLDWIGPAVLGRIPPDAEAFAADLTILLVGETGEVAAWLSARGVPEPPEPMARRGHARAWTTPGTRLAVLSADDGEGLRTLAAALRHHGHRSYLVQGADGSTLEAGVWAFVEEPLRVVFAP